MEHNGLHPSNSILLVIKDNILECSHNSISVKEVGEKAYGLSCIPKLWTLPFIVVCQDFVSEARSAHGKLHAVVKRWITTIKTALLKSGISEDAQLILRSSGINESILNRGKFHTKTARSNNLENDLVLWITEIISDSALLDEPISLVIQKYSIYSSKGHLSNERRCYLEARDWLGEIENEKQSFTINLRNWRHKQDTSIDMLQPLECNIKVSMQNVLKKAAAWGYSQKSRLHFEWVWDGKCIYLVQADIEKPIGQYNPTRFISGNRRSQKFSPKALSKITHVHGKKYHKIHNVLTYMELGLPTTDLYVLDDQKLIREIARGIISQSLEYDIEQLVKLSLVIRTDIVSDDLLQKQLLPRTHEVRDFSDAKNWLIKNSAALITNLPDETELAFIFHNFIPAEASAFAFAAPGERKVQIESLWGIPEGLYYNSHDKFIVDTRHSDIDKATKSMDDYEIVQRNNYKGNCVAPNDTGEWVNQIIAAPYDWNSSIRRKEWIKKIAHDSRLISDKENKPLSIMWFIGVPKSVSSALILPWYHEIYEAEKIPRSLGHRSKTPFDKIFEIQSAKDISVLNDAVANGDRSIRKVLVKPQEESLLRDRNTLQKIGSLVKKIDAVIYLEGATLSHAYYQLIQTGASVEVSHTFKDEEVKQEFNKLVRDKIPEKIESGGEIARAERLIGDDLLRALREKLIEEAFEVLDASDHDSIIEELSDVQEVIDGILSSLKTDMSEVLKAKEKKLSKVGGFKDGVVLVRTTNPAPSAKYGFSSGQSSLPFDYISNYSYSRYRPEMKVNQWRDKREHAAAKETLLKVTTPVTLDHWKSETPQMLVGDETISAEVSVTRKKGEIEFSISVYAKQTQLKLF